MRVLFVSAWFPFPPDNGARIRVFHLLKALSQEYEVFLISLLQNDSDTSQAEPYSRMCRIVSLHHGKEFRPKAAKSVAGFFSCRPRSIVDTYDPALAHAVREAVETIRPDIVVASTLGTAEYVRRYLNVPIVLEEHNCEFAVLKRGVSEASSWLDRFRRELGWRKFSFWEADTCRRFDAVVMVSNEDRQQILRSAPDLKKVYVVPNGVDTSFFVPSPNHAADQNQLIYNGSPTYGANLDAVQYYAREIYPVLREMRPDATLRVTGKTDGVNLEFAANCPGLIFTGYVQDIRTVLVNATACVVPLRQGGGSRLKILEAMALGVPVVSTSIGAEGLDVRDGESILITDSPVDFARTIDRLLSDAALRMRLVANARALVERSYSWSMIGAKFVEIIDSVFQAHRERGRRG